MNDYLKRHWLNALAIFLLSLFTTYVLFALDPGGILIARHEAKAPELGREWVFPEDWTPVTYISNTYGHRDTWVDTGWLCERDGAYRECKPGLAQDGVK